MKTTMRKTAFILLLAFTAISSYAQTAYDALRFSENNYEGTARTVAMGNAFTALGGDLGAVTINPAGSAVAGYSQITLTPALTFSASTAEGLSPYSDGELPYFENKIKSRMTRFSMPNFGINMHYDTNRKSGLKSLSFGFIVNKTADWSRDIYATGTNSSTSFMGALAYDASTTGITAAELSSPDIYQKYDYWSHIIGYQSGMISTFDGYDDQYVGASEVIYDNGSVAVGGPLRQVYGSRTEGGKYDYLFNAGANISDFIYIGVNLGITSIDYTDSWYFKEEAIDPADFEIEYSNGDRVAWENMTYRNTYTVDGTGYYGKVGVIITPGAGIRIGAAISTPVVTNISQESYESGNTTFSDGAFEAESPYKSFQYRIISPFRANFGLAYTIGDYGLISADYEMCDYSQMRFKAINYSDSYWFEKTNEDIREWFGTSHMLRVGAEIKPTPGLAIRAGYGLTTSPDIFYDEYGKRMRPDMTHNASFGLGYSSKGSFFADLALRRNFMQNETIMPYPDYVFDADGNVDTNAYAPELLIGKKMWKVLLTLGWRF